MHDNVEHTIYPETRLGQLESVANVAQEITKPEKYDSILMKSVNLIREQCLKLTMIPSRICLHEFDLGRCNILKHQINRYNACKAKILSNTDCTGRRSPKASKRDAKLKYN